MICPHNKTIVYKEIYGIKVYEHDDGSICNCLNKMNYSFEELLETYNCNFSNLSEDMLFDCSKKIRKRTYKRFSTCKDKEKAVEILQIFAKHYGKDETITSELLYVFGQKQISTLILPFAKVNCSLKSSLNISLVDVNYYTKLNIPLCLDERLQSSNELYDKLKDKINKSYAKNSKRWFNF